MANIAIFRINYKSDFILTLNSDAGWMTPFCIKFWTGAPSQAYFAGYDGTTYTHCAPVEGEPTKLLVQFDDHHLPIGDLKFQIGYHFTVADFPTSVEDEVLNQDSVIIDVDDAPAQVMLDFNGETAPEIQFSLPAYANEAQRIANEQQRIANEQTRISNEETRIAHEQTRINQEQTRQQNEAQRIQQEQARVNEYATLKADAVAATGAANDAAALANAKAQLAADKAALADAAATLANQKAALAASAAQLAADKAALAASAAQLANDKAALAQQKAEYAQTQGAYAKDQGDYAKDQGDYAKDQGDYAKAQGDTALADHQRAERDHETAAADHTTAGDDHTTAAADHTRAESDHSTAADDHTLAGTDHTTAAADHTQAGNDHTRAESDHTRAESDHAAVAVYVDSLGAFDISAYHATGGVLATYADLSAALGSNGANIPELIRKGGMSVRFVTSYDNKYVQYRLMATSFSIIVADWQGIDDVPIAGSNSLIKSGGVYEGLSTLQQEVLSFQRLEATLVSGYYFNKSGSFTQVSSSYCYKYAHVNKGEIVSCKSTIAGSYGGIGIFKSLPSSSSVADIIINSEKATFIAPYDCYIVVTNESERSSTIFIETYTGDEYNTLPICAEKVDAVRKSMCTWHSEDGYLPGFINSDGINANTSNSWRILYVKVYKGDEIKFIGGVSGAYRAGYTDEEPTQGFALSERIPTDTTSPYIATRNGYFCISDQRDRVSLEVNNQIINFVSTAQDVENIKDEIEVHSPEPLSPINKINGCYITKNGVWQNYSSQQVKVYEITENSKYYIRTSANTNYALCAWFSDLPTVGSVPLLTIPYTVGVNLMQEAPTGANYLAITSYVADYDDNKLDAFAETTVKNAINDLQNIVFANGYNNKKCIYIGDSISTSNVYQWKKLIEDVYSLKYVRDLSGQLAPASGGITVRPKEDESETALSAKTIWYRCAENRMSIYDFDIISLFGGTNDMASDTLPIGTLDDIPYVDDASSFETPANYTDVWTSSLTFAQCLMGCIEMLKRDFPTKEIILCTVMPCGGQYGNWTDPVTNLPASEAIANLQVRIANKYGLKVIPFYWNVRTSANSANYTFSLDGVHPNYPCALRMRAAFAEILCL